MTTPPPTSFPTTVQELATFSRRARKGSYTLENYIKFCWDYWNLPGTPLSMTADCSNLQDFKLCIKDIFLLLNDKGSYFGENRDIIVQEILKLDLEPFLPISATREFINITHKILDALESNYFLWESGIVYDKFKRGQSEYNWAFEFKPYSDIYFFDYHTKKFNREELIKQRSLFTFICNAYHWALANKSFRQDNLAIAERYKNYLP